MSDFIYAAEKINLYPAGPSVGTDCKKGIANTYGSYVELVAAVTGDVYVVGVMVQCAVANNYIQVSIGVGAAAVEVEKAVVKVPPIIASYAHGHYVPVQPYLKVLDTERIACKTAGSSGTLDTVYVTLFYVPVVEVENPVLDEVASPNGAVVDDAGNTASSFLTNLTESVDDHWKDSFLKFKDGSLAGQVRKVIGYDGTNKIITCDAFTSIPAGTASFDLINR